MDIISIRTTNIYRYIKVDLLVKKYFSLNLINLIQVFLLFS